MVEQQGYIKMLLCLLCRGCFRNMSDIRSCVSCLTATLQRWACHQDWLLCVSDMPGEAKYATQQLVCMLYSGHVPCFQGLQTKWLWILWWQLLTQQVQILTVARGQREGSSHWFVNENFYMKIEESFFFISFKQFLWPGKGGCMTQSYYNRPKYCWPCLHAQFPCFFLQVAHFPAFPNSH